jgi:hypothetical protein
MSVGGITGMAERIVRTTIANKSGERQAVDIDLAESPLAWLRSRRDKSGEAMINAAEFEAGERFRKDYTIAGLVQRTTMNWESFGGPSDRRSSGPGSGLLITEAAMAARTRVNRALTDIGPELGGMLIDVCCHLKGLGDIEREKSWPLRSGKVVLRLALASLARHYGLDRQATGGERAPIRQWGSADYKPKA